MKTLVTRILVPTDFSRPSELALEYANGLARHFGASVHLLHVVMRPLLAEGLAAEAFMSEAPAIELDLVTDAEARLRELAPEAASTEAIVGHAAKAIINRAEQMGVDLIVMGSHGRTGIAHLVLGSVAEAVVRTATCPVLTVRNSMGRQHVPREHDAMQVAGGPI